MSKRGIEILMVVVLTFSFTILLSSPTYATSGSVVQVENFIRSVIQLIAGLAGLIATGFFVIGGFGYITSSGNPEHLDRAKRTLLWSGIGLAIVIAAFVISSIIVELAKNSFGV